MNPKWCGWEADSYLVLVLGRIALSLWGGAKPKRSTDKNRAPMGPEIVSITVAGVWRKAPNAFPDSTSVLVASTH